MDNTLNIKNCENRSGYITEFDRIAKMILNCTELVTKENSYRIREIEFYYYNHIHTDFYCHKSPRQKLNSKFYFHRFKNPEKYMRLMQKGIDITCGDNNGSLGGILIRAIEDIKSGIIYTGIGKLTNRIIDEIGGVNEITRLYESNKPVFDESACIYMKHTENNGLKILKKHRQGLNSNSKDEDRFYIDSKYNYFTFPELEELV